MVVYHRVIFWKIYHFLLFMPIYILFICCFYVFYNIYLTFVFDMTILRIIFQSELHIVLSLITY